MITLPDGLLLRPAVASDLEQIKGLVRGAQLDQTQLRVAQFVVIVAGAEVVACGQLRRFGRVRELGSLVVAREWRGQGLAEVIIGQLLAEADGPVYLECLDKLVPFYQKYGFVRVGWRALPRELKPKFGLTQVLARVVRFELAMMVHQGQ
jgi:amino-acid N-acetyltransferase